MCSYLRLFILSLIEKNVLYAKSIKMLAVVSNIVSDIIYWLNLFHKTSK